VPVPRQRWPGNLFRYALRAPASPLAPPTVIDREGAEAIDPVSGLPKAGSQSLWSDSPDANLLTGGAAGRLPTVDARHIHSDVASARILDPANRLTSGNARFDRGNFGLDVTDAMVLSDIVEWPATQRTLGDPGPNSPIVVDDPPSGRQVAFAATQDGLLQAFDAESGVELWSWIPKELLPRLPELVRNETTTVRGHGIDGPLVLHRHDPDGDGRINRAAGEHLWLLFGLGRGGNRYYAVDLSAPGDPRVLWSAELPAHDAEASAEPVVTRLAIDGSGQSADDWVVLLAGGYDRRFDSPRPTGAGVGNSLLVLDAATGRLLWTGGDADDDDLRLSGLASLAAAPRALDLDGDGFLDRTYVVDVTGELWRLDFATGRSAASLAEAKLLASLGTGAQRFHATPDVSVARIGGVDRIAIAVGSGWLARPRDSSVTDRIYTIFDQDAAGVLTEPDLHEVTPTAGAMPATAAGWFARLEAHGPGEKIIGPTVTFDHALYFQTYQPVSNEDLEPCGPPRAIRRLYSLDVRSGVPHATAVDSEEDDAEEIAGPGLPVGLRIGFPERWPEACPGCKPRPFAVIGGETFDTGYAGDPVKTSWRKLAPPPASP
jgi:type IV pilus assembly protein PilY1